MFKKCVIKSYNLVKHAKKFGLVKNFWTLSSNNGYLMIPDTLPSESLSYDFKRAVPLTSEEFKKLRSLSPLQPENPYLLKVTMLGEPNVGKSTLTNALVKWKVCAVSRKVHTTRKKTSAILVADNKQIVFLDTPGFVTPELTKKHSLEPSFAMDPLRSITDADIIAVVVDISNKWTNNRINADFLKILYDFKDKKSILVLNKIDAMKSKSRILSLTRILTNAKNNKTSDINANESSKAEFPNAVDEQLQENNIDSTFYQNIEHIRGWPLFSKMFMVSALKNDGIEDLRNYLLSEAVPRKWMYNKSIVTDQHPHEIALMTVKEKLLEYLPNEIPYSINLRITKWEILSTGSPKIDIKIICENSRHKRFVIGPSGKHIAVCVEKSKKAMRESFRKDVVLNLAVS